MERAWQLLRNKITESTQGTVWCAIERLWHRNLVALTQEIG